MTETATSWKLPVGQFSPKDKGSFSYTTVVKRWPTILTQIVSTLSNEIHHVTTSKDSESEASKEKIEEGKEIIRSISELKHDMGRNKVLSPIEDDGGSNVNCYNEHLKALDGTDDTWFTAAWLFAECYLYRRLRTYFAKTKHWNQFDPFFTQKADTYKSSSTAIIHLAKSLKKLDGEHDELLQGYKEKGSAMEVVFYEMMQAALWGNATDLSLLVDLSYSDLQKLQQLGSASQAEQAKFILRNDLEKVWAIIKNVKEGRVDIVLDNAGFELYTDLILADFLLRTPCISEVVFHPKDIPWFVSDVMPYDFSWAIDSLADQTFFAKHTEELEQEDLDILSALSARWREHLSAGRFKLSVPLNTPIGKDTDLGGFWTTQYPYQLIPEKDPKLLKELQKSDLVILKGDLNYRKLVADGKWDPTTPFDIALGPMAAQLNLLSLRTNKADPIVGLPEGTAERLDKEHADWRVDGKYAVVSFSQRTQ